MTRNYIALSLAAALTSTSLVGCASDPTTGVPVIDNTQIAADIALVQKDAAILCGFIPTIGTVTSVIATFTGNGAEAAMATQIAMAICNAVVPAKATAMRMPGHRLAPHRYLGAPTVNGVPIEGYFVR